MKNRNRFIYFLQEVAIVVIGVLIAVSIGNYKEQVDNKNYIEKTLLAIDNEIKLSQAEVDTVLNRHLKLYENLENKFGESNMTIADLVISSGGFQVAAIKNVSLRFFISNKAELLDFKLISQLLEIEFLTDILSNKIQRFTDFSYENINSKDEEAKLKFAYLLSDIIDSEKTLLKSYATFLKENKAYLQDKPKR
jgi:hypothetical protein